MVVLGAVVMLLGLTALVVEAHVSTAGVVGLAGVLAAAAGIGLILAGAGASPGVAVPVAVVLAVIGTVAMTMMAQRVMSARRRALRTGSGQLVGTVATVRSWSGDQGQVAAAGALWSARMTFGWEGPMPGPGEPVIVDELDGLTLSVHRPDALEMM